MMISQTAERKQTREALVDLCFERGYRNLDLAALLERAGISEQVFHRHFADLEDCFCQVYVEIRDDFLACVEWAVAEHRAWRDRLRATAYVLLRFLNEDEKVTHLAAIEVRSAGERSQILLAEALEALFDLIDEGREERGGTAAISRGTAESIGGAIFNQIYAAVGRGVRPSKEIVPGLMYAAVLPYLGPEAAAEELRIAPPPLGDA
jgi:AcrR family transcriptional regulator